MGLNWNKLVMEIEEPPGQESAGSKKS